MSAFVIPLLRPLYVVSTSGIPQVIGFLILLIRVIIRPQRLSVLPVSHTRSLLSSSVKQCFSMYLPHRTSTAIAVADRVTCASRLSEVANSITKAINATIVTIAFISNYNIVASSVLRALNLEECRRLNHDTLATLRTTPARGVGYII